MQAASIQSLILDDWLVRTDAKFFACYYRFRLYLLNMITDDMDRISGGHTTYTLCH